MSRKKSKHKKKARKHSSTSSSSSSEEEWVEASVSSALPSSKTENKPAETTTKRDEWMSMPGFIPCISKEKINSDRNAEKKAKELEAQEAKIYKPSESERELNPYWKNGGSGVPEVAKKKEEPKLIDVPVGDRGLEWLRKALVRTQEQAETEGRSIEDVAVERWGSLQKLYELIEEAEKQSRRKNKKSSHSRSRRDSSHNRSRYESKSRRRSKSPHRRRKHYESNSSSDNEAKHRSGRSSSKSVGKNYSSENQFSNEEGRQRKWEQPARRKDSRFRSSMSPERKERDERNKIYEKEEKNETHFDDRTTSSEVEEKEDDSMEGKKVVTANELAAKMMKAELMGNDVLVQSLKKQLEELRKSEKAPSTSNQRNKVEEEVVVLTSTSKRGFTKPLTSDENLYGNPRGSRKREKIVTHQDGKRQRYFADDDKHTLEDMFAREKLETAEDSNALFAKLASKSKIGSDDSAFDMDDVFLEQASRKDSSSKLEEKQRSQAIAEHKHKERILESCTYCLDSDKMLKHTIVDIGSKCYLSIPSYRSLTEGHCLIVPAYHVASSTLLDEEVWEELQNYRKKLTQMFMKQDEDVVFFESSMNFGRLPHMVLHCVPMPKEIGDMAPVYFKKAILECETEWSTNKKLVDLSSKNVRRAVPKGLPYFAVDFGLQGGFAHVIENEKLFPRNFAQEIIGGMLDLDHNIWRKERPENFENIRKKAVTFTKLWREFNKEECT